ncbi:MAG: methylmalonyl-CoA epimerase [Flavobacteriales bacterium]|jgi:methylmalonyl-CoA/ethylmalonyl-CoA epimerase|nr:methylmalonyl-CoA epimerase [Flavobacteriales bacterium]NCG29495.1 methylmalonyl-CoA epimerase [Bacteroidota bacterium]MBT3963931.1 methylmalonyl-CoA epimerase [Flavobacteriales bacterium]MBT4705632.1 methylmalonyl-CoA epimerase [Flavobacteriales bacterium]MBT4931171.1 methylmalonyl-CoA epimerase [Flavobacteriales bacterium]
MKKIEHIGIAVRDIDTANETYSKLFNSKAYKEEAVASEGVTTSFFMMGESKIELLEATTQDSAIAKFIEKRGEGIHHIAYAVDDIMSERERLIAEGFQAIGDIKEGADNKLVCFFHPKSANGVLVELCQDRTE